MQDSHANPDKTDSSSLRQLAFGRADSSHLVVYITARSLVVYDVLTLAVLWFEELCVTRLVRDPFSPYMAAFEEAGSKDLDTAVFVFKPSSKALVDMVRLRRREPVDDSISAIFLPRKDSMKEMAETTNTETGKSTKKKKKAKKPPSDLPIWLRKSRLMFLNGNQELIEVGVPKDKTPDVTMEEAAPEGDDGVRVKRLEQQTLFGALMMAEERKTDVMESKIEFSAAAVGMPTRAFLEGPLATPTHVLPHVGTLCKEMQGLILAKGKKTEEKGKTMGEKGGDKQDVPSSRSDAEKNDSDRVSKANSGDTKSSNAFWDDALSREPIVDLSWLRK